MLATTQHGGHLAYFEGIMANSVWYLNFHVLVGFKDIVFGTKSCFESICRWVRAIDEFLTVLHSSPYMHVQNKVELIVIISFDAIWSRSFYELVTFCFSFFLFYLDAEIRLTFFLRIFNRSRSLHQCLQRWNGSCCKQWTNMK